MSLRIWNFEWFTIIIIYVSIHTWRRFFYCYYENL